MPSTTLLDRCREWGRRRLEVAATCHSPEDWQARWPAPAGELPFAWGTCWKHTVEYRVDDFAAEAGFFLDLLGLDCNAFGADYCMVMGPEAEFYLSFRPPGDGETSTPAEALSLQFMLADIQATCAELTRRGVEFRRPAAPDGGPDSPLQTAKLATPHGVEVVLWGLVNGPASEE